MVNSEDNEKMVNSENNGKMVNSEDNFDKLCSEIIKRKHGKWYNSFKELFELRLKDHGYHPKIEDSSAIYIKQFLIDDYHVEFLIYILSENSGVMYDSSCDTIVLNQEYTLKDLIEMYHDCKEECVLYFR